MPFKKLLPILFIPIVSFSHPSPFGLEINKTTLSEAKNKYKLAFIRNVQTSGLDIYEADSNQIKFDGLITTTLGFTKEGVLAWVSGQMEKSKFDSVFDGLNGKYKLVEKHIPYVGNKDAKFKDNNTYIFIESPHMSFKMNYLYVNNKLFDKLTKLASEYDENQKTQEKNQL